MATSAAAVNHPGQVKVAHILVEPKDEPMLDELGEQIAAGVATFAELAATHSKCPSGKQGGALGWISRGQTVGEFERAVHHAGRRHLESDDVLRRAPHRGARRARTPRRGGRVHPRPPGSSRGRLDEVNLIDVREQNEWDAAASRRSP